MDLEARLAQAHEELANAGPIASDSSKRVNKEWIPSSTPKNTLVGHRDKINAVSFHPLYSVLASASVDATVKIWDWDTGECERTLKSHTKAVSDCQYDSTGKVLGADSIFSLHIKTTSLTPRPSYLLGRPLHQALERTR